MKRKEILFFIVALVVFNLSLFGGGVNEGLIFYSDRVVGGEVWRVVTHAFVHVSWYHLLLDGAGFLVLYSMLAAKSVAVRLWYFVACLVGSIVAAGVAEPYLSSAGYCGLSGVDHGLMAVCGLEMLFGGGSDRAIKVAGAVSLLAVVGKSVYEAVSGSMFLGLLHFNMMGDPVAVSHFGGACGGVLSFISAFLFKKRHLKAGNGG